jgi:hypothetical protein
MAITRTQIAKQLLAQGGRIGYSVGGRDGPSSSGPSSGPAGGASSGGNYGGNQNTGGGGNRDGRDPMAQFGRTPEERAIVAAAGEREMAKRDVPIGLGDKLGIPSFLPTLKTGLNFFQVPTGNQFAQGFRRSLIDLNRVDPGPDRDGGGIPYWAQLGFNSEAEYLSALAAQGASTTEPEPEEEVGDIRRLAFRAEGGPIGGGIMDLESARQELFLGGVADAIGKGLKKVTRGIKKIGKSPIGKAALLYAGVGGLGNLAGGSGLGGMFRGITNPSSFLGGASKIFKSGGLKNILVGGKNFYGGRAQDFTPFSGIFGSGGELSPLKAIGVTSALSGFLTPEQEDEAQQLADDTGFSIEEARNSILARARDDYKMDFRARGFRAEGGPAEGKEPVAKKTMPLLDMDGKEMDLRAEGGFVPIGRMEKADDVPARLSKNEFVFTADAVRNAGEGDVDKGAEVMYNMMKNLESGGDVSEESQGLDGARKMFQTSQRLEEVL